MSSRRHNAAKADSDTQGAFDRDSNGGMKIKNPFRKAAAASAEKPVRVRRKTVKPTSIDRLFLILVTVACALFVGAGIVIYNGIATSAGQAAAQQGETTIANLATAFTGHVEAYRVGVEAIARDPSIARALEFGDEQALRQREAELAQMFPAAQRVMLLEPDAAEAAVAGDFPALSFADIELIRDATARKATPLETHLFNTPQQHIDLVARVNGPADDVAGGFVLLSLDVKVLAEALRSLQVASGYAEVVQRAQDTELVLATAGDSAHRDATAALRKPVPGTRWELVYWPASGATIGIRDFWWPFAVALILLGAAILGIGRYLAGIVRRDLLTLIDIVGEKNVVQAGGSEHTILLKDFEGAAEILTSMTPAMPAMAHRKPITAVTPPPDAPVNLMYQKDSVMVDTVEVADKAQVPTGSIFKAYDIRGIVGVTLTPQIVHEIGRAIGSEAFDRGQQGVIVARDGRLSGPELTEALIKGLCASGRDVINIGLVPTPVLYFATHYTNTASGVMLTGSHNPPEYNGMKIVLRGDTLSGDAIQGLRDRIEKQNFRSGAGSVRELNLTSDYVQRIASDIRLRRPLKVVVDCGNGAAGDVAPQLLQALGCDVIELFCDIDGKFPNHHPDPSQPENLQDLIRAVKQQGADIGLAFDGDGDRLGVVDSSGEIIWPDRQMMLYARDVLSRNPGAEILFDVKCSRNLAKSIKTDGGKPVMWKTGHSLIKARMKESGALLAGEMSGHIFFKERWYGFDDALYTAARLLEILSVQKGRTSDVFSRLPNALSTPELRLEMGNKDHFAFMEQLAKVASFPDASVTTIDGIRVDFADGWGLVRASNTTPCLVLRFEADNPQALHRIQEDFRRLITGLDHELTLPF